MIVRREAFRDPARVITPASNHFSFLFFFFSSHLSGIFFQLFAVGTIAHTAASILKKEEETLGKTQKRRLPYFSVYAIQPQGITTSPVSSDNK